jgi:putative SOS response-associated peptidase YedK
MCGRFAQVESRQDFFDTLGLTPDDVPFDPSPIGRYNVAPGTPVLILSYLEGSYHFAPVHWGYKPAWWEKRALINARSETAATGRMFKPLWQTGRVIVPATGWFEWKRDGDIKQPYFIHHRRGTPVFFAALGHAPFDRDDAAQGFVIVTAASDKGLVDIHDRMPMVLKPAAALEWLHADTTPEEANALAKNETLPLKDFYWHPVSKKVGSVRHQSADVIDKIDDPLL